MLGGSMSLFGNYGLKGAASKACGGAGPTVVGVVWLCGGWATVLGILCVPG